MVILNKQHVLYYSLYLTITIFAHLLRIDIR